MTNPLVDRPAFDTNGFLVLEGFYDVETEIEPIRRGIHEIIGLVGEHHGVALDRKPYESERFDDGYHTLKQADRRLGAIVYDAVKQLAPFVRLVGSAKNEELFASLRDTTVSGVAGGGSGIRIDNPDEQQYLAWWHQEYPAQLRSLDGLVFWSPLRSLTTELGPVQILEGSQHEGVLPVDRDDGGAGRTGAYALRLRDEDDVVRRHRSVSPLVQAGDLVVLDFLTVHRSGENRADQSRWTMQLRYFNYAEPHGASLGWAGSFAAGNDPADVDEQVETPR